MVSPLILYHRVDDDGVASAVVALRKYPNAVPYGINYGDPIPWGLMPEGRMVIIVDWSATNPQAPVGKRCEPMRRIQARGPLVWIDHHVTAIEDAAIEGFTCEGLRQVGLAGCELTWKYFFGELPMPSIIHHIGRWDVWDHTDEETTLVHFGLMSQDTRVDSPIWRKLLPATPEERSTPQYERDYLSLLHDGRVLHRYKLVQDARTAKAGYFTTTLDGHTVLAINAGGNSDLLASVWDPTKWEFVLLFTLNCRGWKVSIFHSPGRDDVHLGEIAKRYGGGGHRGAAGFNVPPGQPLPFKTPADADWPTR